MRVLREQHILKYIIILISYSRIRFSAKKLQQIIILIIISISKPLIMTRLYYNDKTDR